ncbi:hypothetical protein HYU40_04955 [Candidatus Woesearchaeota archaeon]|nr:hypothetical protein [Candidatus Woesearchaeota archaeon]
MPAALAHEDNASADDAGNAAAEDATAGVMPDSPLYFLETAFSRLSLALTFDKAAKAEKGLKIAQERLLEVKAMAKEGKLKEAAKAEGEYETALVTATKAAEEIESDGNSNAARNAMEKISWLQNQTESHYMKVTEAKDEILQRQKERMSPEQIAHLQQVFSKIEDKAHEMEIKLDSKKDRIKIKEKALANLTSEQADALEMDVSEKTGLTKGRHERAEKEMERAKEAIERAKEQILEKKAEGADVEEIEKLLDEAEKRAKNLRTDGDKKNKSAQYNAEELTNLGNKVSEIAESLGDARKEGNFSEALGKLKKTIRERKEEKREDRSGNDNEDDSDEKSGSLKDVKAPNTKAMDAIERQRKKAAEAAGQQQERQGNSGKNEGTIRRVAAVAEKPESGKSMQKEQETKD